MMGFWGAVASARPDANNLHLENENENRLFGMAAMHAGFT